MGSGKTTIGTRVAAALDREFVDNDELLASATGTTAAEIAARDGIDALHRLEASVVLGALQSPDPSVIAAAASTIADPEVRAALRRDAWVVWLRADQATLVARLPGSSARPYADHDAARLVEEQSRRRDPLFADVADAMFETDESDVAEVVTRVLASARERRLRM